jgi:hypothetical protein
MFRFWRRDWPTDEGCIRNQRQALAREVINDGQHAEPHWLHLATSRRATTGPPGPCCSTQAQSASSENYLRNLQADLTPTPQISITAPCTGTGTDTGNLFGQGDEPWGPPLVSRPKSNELKLRKRRRPAGKADTRGRFRCAAAGRFLHRFTASAPRPSGRFARARKASKRGSPWRSLKFSHRGAAEVASLLRSVPDAGLQRTGMRSASTGSGRPTLSAGLFGARQRSLWPCGADFSVSKTLVSDIGSSVLWACAVTVV